MAAAQVDTAYVAGALGLEEPIITNLTTSPTADLFNSSFLPALIKKLHEYDELYSSKLQLSIELEGALHSSDARTQTSKATVEKALKETEEARQKAQEEETKRQTAENELLAVKSKLAEHEPEIKALNDKIETLQSSNRTNLTIIESHNKRDETVADELKKQHERNVQLNRDITAAQQAEQNARGQLTSSKYREESTRQQLELANRNVEWLEGELKTKSEEALKYRKEKGARISELQRQNEDFRAAADSAKRSEQQLRTRLETMQTKVDDTLVTLQKQEAQAASTIESLKRELEDQRRLVDMSNQLTKQHTERIQTLSADKERTQDNHEAEMHRLRVELEREQTAAAESEEKIRQLEASVEELQSRPSRPEHASPPPPGSAPQTPRPNGSMMRPSSPFGTPGSIRSKGNMTATQAIEQLHSVKLQLVSEKRRSKQLSEEVDSMMSALEAKAPEIQELHSEVETLREEIARMSEMSQQSFEERDVARRGARKAEGSLATVQSENNILRTQLRDLGTQIQMLVFNVYALEKGVEQLTDEEKYRLQQLEQGEISEEALSDMTETHQFITRKLVVFKDIKSLQAKNEELLRITRELAEQMESDEAVAAKHQAKEDHDKVEKLEQELSHMTDEARSIKNTMDSYKTERDMFRRLLQQRSVGGEQDMRMSLDGRLPLASIESTEQVETLNEALRKSQGEFDTYREAQEGVRKEMREHIERLTSEQNTLHTDKIKLQGEVRLESERREMLSANYAALQNEKSELQKRVDSLSETAAKQDLRTQEVVENLVQAQGLLDSVKNENANLKAEKTLWKDIQERQNNDNTALIEEKNRLSNLLATQQSLENERNINDSKTRRKAQARIEQLEQELGDAQKKVAAEAEETKQLQQRKEFEAKEAQKRIDDLMASLSQVREEHITVKSARDHAQARVDELTVELRNAEERATRLQPRPTPRPGATDNEQQQQLEAENAELEEKVADLKRELDIATTHLESAKEQAEQYKELSQGNEEALEDLRGSQEQYREEMEALVNEKESRIKELSQRIEDVTSELRQSNAELSGLRDSQGEIARKYEDEKVILDEEITRLKDDSARHQETARYHQQDLRAQAEIATKAQQDYEHELVKHAEAAQLLQQVRTDYNTLKSEVAGLRAEAESAKVALAQGEGSWEDRRQQLEQEITDLKARREDANAQNKLLHQQLESVSAQVTALQQSRNDAEGDDEAMSPIPVGDASEGLRELNNYLRREKEILEVQYDLKTSEAKRLQQQVEYTQSQLDEARLKLDQERTQASESGRGNMTHQNLMEKLNELNLYRESSMTLRNENGQLKDQLAEKNKKIEELEGKVQPLETEIDNLKTQISYLEEEMKQVQEDRERWQKRTETILTKYGRVDPAEMDELKTKMAAVEGERDALKAETEPLKEKVTELEATLKEKEAAWTTSRGKIIQQAKDKAREQLGKIRELEAAASAAASAQQGAQESSEASTQRIAELESQVEGFQKQVEELNQQAGAANAQQSGGGDVEMSGDANASSEIVTQLEQQLANLQKEKEALNAQKLGAEQQRDSLREELQTAIAERDTQIEQLKANGGSEGETPAATTAPAESGSAPALTNEEKAALEEKIATAETKAAEAEKKATEIEASMAATLKKRSDQMKEALNKKLQEEKLKFEQEKAIWKAENTPAAPGPGVQATAPAADQAPPATPAKAEAGSVPPTPTTAGPVDFANLDDAGVRAFLSSNQTAKTILTNNIKKKVEMETAKLKTEWEEKVKSARDQAQMMESKKSALRINMLDNKIRGATAKLGVVETAATETPEKPVGEVWEVAKSTPTPPAPAAAPKQTPIKTPGAAAAATPAAAATAAASATPAAQAPAQAQPATPAPKTPATPAAGPAAAAPAPAPANGTGPKAAAPANPFATSTGGNNANANNGAPAANPFASSTISAAGSGIPKAAPAAQAGHQGQPATRGSGIPMARGGAGRGGRGAYQHPGQRAASAAGENGQQPSTRGGRGGARGGGRGGLNAGAQDFQPGNKRPRGDSEIGAGGAKRARGGGQGGAAQ